MSNIAISTRMEQMAECPGEIGREENTIPTIVDHAEGLSFAFEELFTTEDLSDVTFLVEGERIKGHKIILATRSAYFRALLFGGLKETDQSEIKIHDAGLFAFKILMKYIYTGRIQIFMTEEQIIEVLGLAHKFFLRELENAIAKHLMMITKINNFCTIFNVALMYEMEDLIRNSLNFADLKAQDILCHESFVDLDIKAVEELAGRDSFYAPEIDIFKAVKEWIECEASRKKYAKNLLAKLRLPLIKQKDLLDTVRPSALLSSDDLLDAIHEQQTKKSSELVHRGCLKPDFNVACIQEGAKVLKGEAQGAFLNGDQKNPSHNCTYFTRHAIGDNEGIVVELGKSWMINTIRLYVNDRENTMYSYYVEVSMDNTDWLRVVDYSNYPCRGPQNLLFKPRAVRYIKIIGVSNTVSNRHFHVAVIEALYSTDKLFQLPPPPYTDIPMPTDNIATIERLATVIEGVSRSRNVLLNGLTEGYDWDTGYTCHQVGSGSITVQLPQPYVVNSMRLLLWDCDERYYSYYVEVSLDQKEWKLVADRKIDQCKSWQLLKFPTTSVVFVRIIGVHNSANEVFHCVHFECPASPESHPDEEVYVYKPQIEAEVKQLSLEEEVLESDSD